MSFLSRLFGGKGEQKVQRALKAKVEQIHTLQDQAKKVKLEEFPGKTKELKKRLEQGESLDDVLPLAFAYVREVASRVLEKRHYDVQLMGGIALHEGKVIEMRTGEGKTLTATAPLYLNALAGKGVHLITVNDYLAMRDGVWMGQIYHALGLSVGVLTDNQSFIYDPRKSKELDERRDELGSFRVEHEFLRPVSRKEVYDADVVYGTNHAFGFDYLRDNLAPRVEQQVMRPPHYAIVDEVDSILIDEARTPLIISAPQEDASRMYSQFASLVRQLKKKTDYNVDEKRRAVALTQTGLKHVEKLIGRNVYEQNELEIIFHLDQALKAHTLYLRDRDYVLRDDKVIIVDEFTGRLMPDRRYSEGIHQALEAKEGVRIQAESKTVATITIQNFFKKYAKLSGMTGTAVTSAEEFDKVYGMDVVIIPTHKPMVRQDLADRIYRSANGKWQAIVKEIKERQNKGQPVLVGTVSVEKNEFLARLLKKAGVKFSMLNAKQHEQEGQIIAQAGRKKTVTVATNMAGRGVDIILGGNPYNQELADEVRELGGLYVLGTERHEARRIDNQLRGRAGRQGDPGQTQFFISTEDDLMRIFGGDRIHALMTRFNFPEDMPIENKMISSSIERAQSQVEGYNFDIRKRLLEYDDVINKQRDNIYKRRQEILQAQKTDPEITKTRILQILEEELDALIQTHTGEDTRNWNIKEIQETFTALTGKVVNIKEDETKEAIHAKLKREVTALYQEREKEVGEETMRAIEKEILLRSIDMSWSDYLVSLDHLRQTVGLRAVGGHDPLVEFKREARRMFDDLLFDINQKVADTIFKIQAQPQSQQASSSQVQAMHATPKTISGQAPSGEINAQTVPQGSPGIKQQKIGRNDPCPCGSGKKYKKCHGA